MAKDRAAVSLGRRGGKATLRKHGKAQYSAMGKLRRKPDNAISDHARYMREYRAKRAKKNEPLEPTSCE